MRGKFTIYNLQFTILAIFFAFYILHSTFYIPVSAQEICRVNEECPEDTYYTDGTTGQCIHKHGGYCDEECVYAYDEADDEMCQAPPTPSPSSSTAPIPESSGESRLENIVGNLSRGVPTQGIPEKPQPGLLERFALALRTLLGIIKEPAQFFVQSQAIHNASAPKDFTPLISDPVSNIKNSLGGQTGVFGENLPRDIQSNDPNESLENFEDSYYPKEVD